MTRLVTLLFSLAQHITPQYLNFFLLFLSEFLAEESQEMFWDFVEAIQNTEGERDGTEQTYYELVLKKAGSLLSSGDHKFPGSNPEAPVVVLYAEVGTRAFQELHQVAASKAHDGVALYVLRHYLA
ncbi:hypothetical protein CRUP_034753, partial [Coryphaenoides rupestris]